MKLTTFILHGGETSKDSADNNEFFRRFTQYVDKDSVQILMCYFAKRESTWEQRLEQDRVRVTSQAAKNVALTLALTPEDLLAKLPSHDVLYVAGGDAQPLESYLPKLAGLGSLLLGKVYVGCSMGAFIVSESYVLTFDDEPPKVHAGLGLIPISTLCHWDAEPRRNLKIELLKAAAPTRPILTLDECKHAVLIG